MCLTTTTAPTNVDAAATAAATAPALAHLDTHGNVKKDWTKKTNFAMHPFVHFTVLVQRVKGTHFYENAETGEISHPALPKVAQSVAPPPTTSGFPNKIAARNRIIANNERAHAGTQPLQRSASDDMRQAMDKYEAKKKAALGETSHPENVEPAFVFSNHSFGSGPALTEAHLDEHGKVKKGWKKKKNRVKGTHFYENAETGTISVPMS